MTRHAFICDAVRTPFGCYGGDLCRDRQRGPGRSMLPIAAPPMPPGVRPTVSLLQWEAVGTSCTGGGS
jgi:hypothetical protein